MATRGRRVHSIEKSIQLLDCFWQVRRPLSLSELERMTGWAKSTIHGLLASMLDSAVVEQNATDGKYRLGYHLFELGSAVSQGWSVPEICKPHLQTIVDQLRESAYLARYSGDELILVDCEEPHAGFRVASEAGTRLPLHCTSQGKIVLACMSESEAATLLARALLTPYTPHTETDANALLASLPACREAGFAVENGEYKIGLRSISAPVFTGGGALKYVVSVLGMFRSVHSDEFAHAERAVVAAGQMLSAALGYPGK